MKHLGKYLTVAAVAMLAFTGCKDDENSSMSISLDPAGSYDFPAETDPSYAAKEPLIVTVTNTGTQATGRLSIAIDGAAADNFELSATAIGNIEPGQSATFTVVPVQGLDYGDYSAIIYVSGNGVPAQQLKIRFVVTEYIVKGTIVLKTEPTKKIYGIGEPIDLTGLEVVEIYNGVETAVTIKPEYLHYDFSKADTTTVDIGVGSAPVVSYEVIVKSLAGRVADVAVGDSANIIVYANEETTRISVPIDVTVRVTTADNKEKILKRTGLGDIFNIRGKLYVDGYITMKGVATPEYGGSDDHNNNSCLVTVGTDGFCVMKGNSKLTTNARVPLETDGYFANGSFISGGIEVLGNGVLILDENAQITGNTIGCTKTYPEPFAPASRNGKVVYSGAVGLYAADGKPATLELRGNAKITKNRAFNKGGNAYGGAVWGQYNSKTYMYGGEISENEVEATHVAAGAAVNIVNGYFYMYGGVIKNNIMKYGVGGAGGAVRVGNSGGRFIIGGSASIPSGGSITAPTGSDIYYVDTRNTVHLQNIPADITIDGTLTGASPVATIDIDASRSATRPVLYNWLDLAQVAFIADAPKDKFVLGVSSTFNTAPTAIQTTSPLTGKEIKADGTIGDR